MHKTSVREESIGVYLPVGLSFAELFDDILLMFNLRRLCVVVDSLFSAAKVCDCVITSWCLQVCDGLLNQREPRLLARVDQMMPKLQILLDKGNVTFNNNNKRKGFRVLNFPRRHL